jgi:hypothetical protein
MSRSIKKVPGFSDSEGSKVKEYFLRLMNRRIRRLDPMDERKGISNGNFYRRFVNRWDFQDYSFRYFTPRALKASWSGEDKIYKAIRK